MRLQKHLSFIFQKLAQYMFMDVKGFFSKGLDKSFKNILNDIAPEKPLTESEVGEGYNTKIQDILYQSMRQDGVNPIVANVFSIIGTLAVIPNALNGNILPLIQKNILQPSQAKYQPTLLDNNAAIESWLRGLTDDAALKAELNKAGLSDERINILKELAEFKPGARDIIQFAVREAYNPGIIASQGQDEGFSEVMSNAADDLKRAGLSEEQFYKMWVSHWQLPGIQQMFEMLHRKQINSSQLDDYMIAADIMPGYREALKAISYNPYTRVDVRRMHKFGVLTDEQLQTAYEDLGFSPEKATKMKEFTISYNKANMVEDMTADDYTNNANRDMTKSEILKGYGTGLLTESECKSLLSDMGYADDTITYYMVAETYKQEEEKADKYIAIIKESYMTGLYDVTKAKDELNKLGLPTKNQEYLLEYWELDRETSDRLPTKSEILSFYQQEYITEDEARKFLQRHRYSNQVIDLYIKSVNEKE